jgi:DNA invertase Pin-like site-specific DNA recombinase
MKYGYAQASTEDQNAAMQLKALKRAGCRGVKFGRKPKVTPQQVAHARKLIKYGEASQAVASLLRVSRATVYRALTCSF